MSMNIPPVPEAPAPEKKPNSTRTLAIVIAVTAVVGIGVGAAVAGDQDPAGRAGVELGDSAGDSAGDPAHCIETSAMASSDRSLQAMQDAQDAIAVYDVSGAADAVDDAADGWSDTADAVHGEIALSSLMDTIALKLRSSASNLRGGALNAAISDLESANGMIKDATRMLGTSGLSPC